MSVLPQGWWDSFEKEKHNQAFGFQCEKVASKARS